MFASSPCGRGLESGRLPLPIRYESVGLGKCLLPDSLPKG